MTTPFDYIQTINKKQGVYPDDDISEFEKVYSQFLVNRQFSHFADTVLLAQEMNQRTTPQHALTNRMNFEFYYNILSKASRFSKWEKPTKYEDIDIIQKYYGYSLKEAQECLCHFTEEHINKLRIRLDEGGVINGKSI